MSSSRERQAAIAQFQEVLQLDPMLEDAYLSLGTLYEEERNYTAARIRPRIAASAPARIVPWAISRLARVMVELKDYATAEAMLQKAISLNPDFDRAWIALGGVYEAQGKDQDAIRSIRRL